MIRTLRQRLVYENDFVSVFDDDVEFPNGTTGRYFRTRWKAPFGVAIIAVREERVLLIRNYRYAEQAWSLEICQGFGRAGHDPAAEAQRELLEEAGLEVTGVRPLIQAGLDYVTHGFVGDVVGEAAATGGGAEHSEALGGYIWLPVVEINPARLAELGVREPNSLAMLLAFKAQRG